MLCTLQIKCLEILKKIIKTSNKISAYVTGASEVKPPRQKHESLLHTVSLKLQYLFIYKVSVCLTFISYQIIQTHLRLLTLSLSNSVVRHLQGFILLMAWIYSVIILVFK